MILRAYLFLIALAACLAAPLSLAAPRPFTLDNTEVIDFHAQANNKDYEIYVRLPDSYAKNPARKFPLVVLTDGYYAFPLLSAINWRMSERHSEYQQAIVVGISYSKGDDINESRTRDFTPTRSREQFNSDAAQAKSGGASRYLAFIGDELLPYVQSHYRVDSAKKIFAGHSFGGLLATYMLFTRPQLFDYYLIGSPSLWYDNKVMFRLESDYAATHKNLAAKVFMATGAEEDEPAHGMVQNMFALEKALRSRRYPGLSLEVKSLPDEGHLSGYPAFITQGLLWALPPPT
jgi:uncharacterized protein